MARPRIFRLLTPSPAVTQFLKTETSAAGVLLAAAVVALVLANTGWAEAVSDFWHTKIGFSVGPLALEEDIQHWINDGLMALFFFVVGLEIRRELTDGELSSWRRAVTPGMAAVGGMLVPAAIYGILNAGGPGGAGWGIPMATDIAFAVGVLALVGDRVPSTLRAFLLSLAIVDDIGAITVIAIFYTSDLNIGWLVAAGVLSALILVGRRFIPWSWVYVPIGIALWFFVLESGVHATIAGIALAFLLPSRINLEGVEHRLHTYTAFLVLPLFALANAGVSLSGSALAQAAGSSVTWGVGLGLVAGKLIGIPLFTYLAAGLRLGELPDGVTVRHIVGLSGLAGIGFTVSLFITGLAFTDAAIGDAAKVGIVAGSVVAGLVGIGVLRAGNDD